MNFAYCYYIFLSIILLCWFHLVVIRMYNDFHNNKFFMRNRDKYVTGITD